MWSKADELRLSVVMGLRQGLRLIRGMRRLWLPITIMLIVVLTIWLGIFRPLPEGFAVWLRQWQTLVAAVVALLFAAGLAFHNTTRSLHQSAEQEARRRARKHAALRAYCS
jgi:hypothetical protein